VIVPTAVTVDDVRRAVAGSERERLTWDGFRQAAVLVPLLDRPDGGPALLFTVRAAHLPHHAGQIAFPGGRFEPGEDAIGAALREAREEVGLEVHGDDVIGLLDDHPSPYGMIATPVVARVPWPAVLELQVEEVSETFIVPLARLASTRPSFEDRVTNGVARRLHRYDVDGYSIWGLTGNVVKDLLDRVAAIGRDRGGP
jgi:8-oxo-dGTP pyrophosphatase MutT (NUDIX family)